MDRHLLELHGGSGKLCLKEVEPVYSNQDGAKQVTVVVALENASFAKYQIAENSHLFTESTTAYVENFSPKVDLLQNGNLQMRQTYFVKLKHQLQVSSS